MWGLNKPNIFLSKANPENQATDDFNPGMES